MIIFDLDGTLADCNHRRHYIDPKKNKDYFPRPLMDLSTGVIYEDQGKYIHNKTGEKFQPNWKRFFDECDKDEPIRQTTFMLNNINVYRFHVEIWSGRCESVRVKTEEWLINNIYLGNFITHEKVSLKMRPEGDYTPDEVLKESWLDEIIAYGQKIDFVVDDRPKVVDMWRRRGIFVFDVNQSGQAF